MSTATTNYNLTKPASTDNYDIAVPNANMDIIDATLKGLSDGKASNSDLAKYTHYGTCTTAAATAAKAVTCSGFVLETGAEIEILFTYGNTAASPTLNINSTSAKSIIGAWSDGQLMRVRYDGTNFVLLSAYVPGLWTKIRDIADVTGTTQTVSFSLSDISFSTLKKIKLVGYIYSTDTTVDTMYVRVNAVSASYAEAGLMYGSPAYYGSASDIFSGHAQASATVPSLVEVELTLSNSLLAGDFKLTYSNTPIIGTLGNGTISSISTFDIVDATTGKYPVTKGFSLWGMK